MVLMDSSRCRGETLNHFLHITLTTEGTAFHHGTEDTAENRKKEKEGKEVSKEKRDPCASQKGIRLKVSLFLEKEPSLRKQMRLQRRCLRPNAQKKTTRRCRWAGSGHMSQLGRLCSPRFGVSSDYMRLRSGIVLYVGEKMKDLREMTLSLEVLKIVRDAL